MLKTLTAAFLAIFIVAVPPVQADHHKILDMVGALSWTHTNQDTGMSERSIHCTAFAVGPHEWVTAAHCVSNGEIVRYLDYEIGPKEHGIPVRVRLVDLAHDLAGLILIDSTLTTNKEWLTLANKEPEIGDFVESAGYAWGLPAKFYVTGALSVPKLDVEVEGNTKPYTMFMLNVCPGQSGSPIVNKKGKLVSVVQIGLERCTAFSGGVPYSNLRSFMDKLFAEVASDSKH